MALTVRVGPGVAVLLAFCVAQSACGSSDNGKKGGPGGSGTSSVATGGASGASGGSAGSLSQSGAGGAVNSGRGGGGTGGAGGMGAAGKGGASAGAPGSAGVGGAAGSSSGLGGASAGHSSAGSPPGGAPAAGEGGAAGAAPSCDDLEQQFTDELTNAKRCDPSASTPQCQTVVSAPLGCSGCAYIVNDATKLFAIKAAFEDQVCMQSFCPQSPCTATELGICMGSGAEGTCLDRQP